MDTLGDTNPDIRCEFKKAIRVRPIWLTNVALHLLIYDVTTCRRCQKNSENWWWHLSASASQMQMAAAKQFEVFVRFINTSSCFLVSEATEALELIEGICLHLANGTHGGACDYRDCPYYNPLYVFPGELQTGP